MRLTLEQRQEREREVVAKAERRFERMRSRFRKAVKGAVVTFEDGWICFRFPNAQVFKCRGAMPESIYGCVTEETK